MSKEIDTIPITLVLPHYEVKAVIHALQMWADFDHRQGTGADGKITAPANKIHSEVREQLMAFEDQNEEENPNPK